MARRCTHWLLPVPVVESRRALRKYCYNCATETQPNQVICTKCSVSLQADMGGKQGCGRIARFFLDGSNPQIYLDTKEGLIMILVSLIGASTCGISIAVISVIDLIEGILYLTKSDDEFAQTYISGRKGWFKARVNRH